MINSYFLVMINKEMWEETKIIGSFIKRFFVDR